MKKSTKFHKPLTFGMVNRIAKAMKPKNKKIKAWAIKCGSDIAFGTRCDYGENHDEFYLAVFENKGYAETAKKLHKEFYRGFKVVPIEITIK